MRYKLVKGTKDIFLNDINKWQYIESTSKKILEDFGYSEIRTPIFESTDLFSRSIGVSTDIVEKEMYSFKDKKGRDLTLRPEGTASIVRAYVEHSLVPPVKFYHIGTMYRYEKPQSGRYREFYQIGIEAIGSISPFIDCEVIDLALFLLSKLGLTNLKIRLNSIGCRKCREVYKKILLEYLKKKELCKDCIRRMNLNPFRVLDCKNEQCIRVTSTPPSILNSLCEDCKKHFAEVKEILAEYKISYFEDPRLFRGLDYYTKTTFEIVTDELGAKNSVLGGGRYDYLVEELGGDSTPAIGWAFGVDRLILALESAKFRFPDESKKLIFIAWTTETAKKQAFKIARRLRTEGFRCEMNYEKSLKAQLKLADRLEAKLTVIVGANELKEGKVILRNMEDGSQRKIDIEKIESELKQIMC